MDRRQATRLHFTAHETIIRYTAESVSVAAALCSAPNLLLGYGGRYVNKLPAVSVRDDETVGTGSGDLSTDAGQPRNTLPARRTCDGKLRTRRRP